MNFDIQYGMIERRQKQDFSFTIQRVSGSQSIAPCVACALLLSLSWTTVILRMFTRGFMIKALGADDWILLFSQVCFTILGGGIIASALLVTNKNQLSAFEMTRVTNIFLAVSVFYICCIATLKISLAIFFLRITRDKKQKLVIYILLTVTGLLGFAYMWFAIFQCGVPGRGGANWYKRLTHRCATPESILGFGYTHAIVTCLTDAICVLLPIPMIRKAQLLTREKLIISALFIIAGVGCIASIIRVNYVRVLTTTDSDFWGEVRPLAIWSVVECGLGIICSSVATLRPLIKKTNARIKARSGHTGLSETGRSSRPRSIRTQSPQVTLTGDGRKNRLSNNTTYLDEEALNSPSESSTFGMKKSLERHQIELEDEVELDERPYSIRQSTYSTTFAQELERETFPKPPELAFLSKQNNIYTLNAR